MFGKTTQNHYDTWKIFQSTHMGNKKIASDEIHEVGSAEFFIIPFSDFYCVHRKYCIKFHFHEQNCQNTKIRCQMRYV